MLLKTLERSPPALFGIFFGFLSRVITSDMASPETIAFAEKLGLRSPYDPSHLFQLKRVF
jgi:hypothetical protein